MRQICDCKNCREYSNVWKRNPATILGEVLDATGLEVDEETLKEFHDWCDQIEQVED